MIKVYEATEITPPETGLADSFHSLPFLIEPEHFEFTHNITEADIIHTINWKDYPAQKEFIRDNYTNQLIVYMPLFHIDETINYRGEYEAFKQHFKDITEKVMMFHPDKIDIAGRQYEYSYNLNRFAFTRREPIPHLAHLDNKDLAMYELTGIEKHDPLERRKKLMVPGRIFPGNYHMRMFLRMALMRETHNNQNYYSDPTKGIVLPPQVLHKENTPRLYSGMGGNWFPISNFHYNTSYISVFVESLVEGNRVAGVTEKTWIPLTKGHFILPFSTPNFIKLLKTYDIKFPDWINYSYDEQFDTFTRFTQFMEEVNRLQKIPIELLHEHFEQDKHILEHNRNVLINAGGYDSLYEKLKDLL